MKKEMISKTIVMGVIVLFIGVSVIPSTVGVIDKKTTIGFLNLGGFIQDLIDNASDGDTIYIPSGIYYENITINKSISLVGEDNTTTIIDGGGEDSVVTIVSENVTVENFFIQNGGNSEGDAGISIKSNRAKIQFNNIMHNNWNGVIIESYFNDNIVIENDISHNGAGGGIIILDLRKKSLQGGKGGEVDLLFIDPEENGYPYSQRKIQMLAAKVCRTAGLRRRHPHDLRHTYASILLMSNKSPAYVQKQLGHHSIQTTVDIYGHWVPGQGRDNLDEAFIEKEDPEKPVLMRVEPHTKRTHS